MTAQTGAHRITAKIIADSIAPNGKRLTTFLYTGYRPVLVDVNTHGMVCGSAESSRAVPVRLRIQRVREDPMLPVQYTAEQKGMTGSNLLPDEDAMRAEAIIRDLAAYTADAVERLISLPTPLHKGDANRYLEPFITYQGLLTATEWANFFWLRTASNAHPAFYVLARKMLWEYEQSTPKLLLPGEWHMPFGDQMHPEATPEEQLKVSAARCARTSYAAHDGEFSLIRDLGLQAGLIESVHMGPFQHQGTPHEDPNHVSGRFRGWVQYRKTIPGENHTEMPHYGWWEEGPNE